MARVLLEKVSKKFGDLEVVKEFTLEVPDREFCILVGPSGCGKTTTLRMVAGLEEITSGSIYIGDRKVNDLPPKDRDIAMVFQNYALYPHMTVYDNMAFGLKLRGYSKKEIDQRVKEAAEILSIGHLLERRPKQLSGGQKQRVAVGRAIVRKPKVFLFDEPLSNLDAKLRVQMRAELKKIHDRLQSTMIYVTHDQTEAMTMGDKIVVMKDGVVNQIDSPLNLYNFPINKFVAGFIGSPSMNFISGTVSKDSCLTFKSTGGELVIKLAPDFNARLDKYINKNLWLGIRPEDIYDMASTSVRPSFTSHEFGLEVVEPMGNEIFLYFQVDGIQFTARIPARENPEPGTKRTLYFDSEKLHFFDTDTESAI